MINVYLIPVKFSNKVLLDDIKQGIEKTLPVNVEERIIDFNIDEFYSEQRGQYFSTQIIFEASKQTERLNGKVLLLTEADLYVPVLTFIFGEAQLNGKHSLISMCRLHEEFYSDITDNKLLYERALKEILHELGHNFGLTHCNDWDCVMHSSPAIEEVDIKGSTYCRECMKELAPYFRN
jgi:Predicted Zn-dependent proteases